MVMWHHTASPSRFPAQVATRVCPRKLFSFLNSEHQFLHHTFLLLILGFLVFINRDTFMRPVNFRGLRARPRHTTKGIVSLLVILHRLGLACLLFRIAYRNIPQ